MAWRTGGFGLVEQPHRAGVLPGHGKRRSLWSDGLLFVAVVGLAAVSGAGVAYADQPAESESASRESAGKYWVYVGTYTGGKSEGIYLFELDLATGELVRRGVTTGIKNPSFLAIHPSHRYLYAVGEFGDVSRSASGMVTAFQVDATNGSLEYLNQQSSHGAGPCHLVVDRSGQNVLVANYGGGSVACLPIGGDGKLGEATSAIQHEGSSVNPRRQTAPHAHSINLDVSNRFAFAADLGLDKILVYRFDAAKGLLRPNDPPFARVAPGAGPRHFATHPSGRFAYVINELDMTVTAFAYDRSRGVLEPMQTASTLPEGVTGEGFSTAEVRVHPSGKFLYGSNRGHDSIVVFGIDASSGRLSYVENEPTQGKTPRNFALDPTGKYLFAENQASDTVVVFRIDEKTGELEPTGQVVDVPSPVCIRMIPISG